MHQQFQIVQGPNLKPLTFLLNNRVIQKSNENYTDVLTMPILKLLKLRMKR